MKNACLVLGLLFLFCSCASSDTVRSDEVSQNVIYQYYSATYDDEEQELSIRAQFRVGGATGTTVQLIDPSQVKYFETELEESSSSLAGTSYSDRLDSDFVEDHEWTYINGDSEVFVNQARMPIVDFPDISVNIPLTEDLQIEWDGEALSENESIQLLVKDSNDFSVSASSFSEGETSVTLLKEDLQLLEPGLVRISLIREKTKELDESTDEGGQILTRYSTRIHSFNLNP